MIKIFIKSFLKNFNWLKNDIALKENIKDSFKYAQYMSKAGF